jgi:hypothetical protein
MAFGTTDFSGAALLAQIVDDEKARRRTRTEQGRSPAQRTTRSTNKARAAKFPGKGNRNAWKRGL